MEEFMLPSAETHREIMKQAYEILTRRALIQPGFYLQQAWNLVRLDVGRITPQNINQVRSMVMKRYWEQVNRELKNKLGVTWSELIRRLWAAYYGPKGGPKLEDMLEESQLEAYERLYRAHVQRDLYAIRHIPSQAIRKVDRLLKAAWTSIPKILKENDVFQEPLEYETKDHLFRVDTDVVVYAFIRRKGSLRPVRFTNISRIVYFVPVELFNRLASVKDISIVATPNFLHIQWPTGYARIPPEKRPPRDQWDAPMINMTLEALSFISPPLDRAIAEAMGEGDLFSKWLEEFARLAKKYRGKAFLNALSNIK